MKNFIPVPVVIAGLFFLQMVLLNQASAQTYQKGDTLSNQIPSEVKMIIEKSCANCHSEPGKTMALTHLNFSKWEQYSPAKQADKVKAMCNEISKDKMPPQKYRANFPNAVLNADEIKTICDWATSLQTPKN